jgi:protein N-lysine methyltransferase METTL21D
MSVAVQAGGRFEAMVVGRSRALSATSQWQRPPASGIHSRCCRAMYYYLSFLRTPPAQVSVNAKLYIKPQIANDLRTELFEGIVDISYTWTQEPTANGTLGASTGQLVKLTTWRGSSSAYKDIAVPAPSGVRDGQYWRLILIASSSVSRYSSSSRLSSPRLADNTELVLGIDDDQDKIFPVRSMPILFTRHLTTPVNSGGGKQDQIERVLSLVPSRTQSEGELWKSFRRRIRITEQTSFDLDKVGVST